MGVGKSAFFTIFNLCSKKFEIIQIRDGCQPFCPSLLLSLTHKTDINLPSELPFNKRKNWCQKRKNPDEQIICSAHFHGIFKSGKCRTFSAGVMRAHVGGQCWRNRGSIFCRSFKVMNSTPPSTAAAEKRDSVHFLGHLFCFLGNFVFPHSRALWVTEMTVI